MTDLRTAAQQALEALELVTDLTNHDDEIYDAIDTLRAALVEDAMQKFTDVNQELEAALAEPAQEPVAHKHEWFSTGAMEPGKMRCIHCGIWNQENAPPQRKPLTETSAERTLKRLGYTDCGGEFWKPPLGAPAEPVQEPVAYSVGRTLHWHEGKGVNDAQLYLAPPQRPAEPVQEPAQQDNETIAQTFSGLPKRKLRELLAAGWQINGVCFQRTEEDGTVRRGAATTGGMVLWWNQEQPAQQQEPVAWRYVPSDVWGDPIVTQDPRTVELARQYGRPIEPLYAAPPQRKPLTEEEIDGLMQSIGLRCADDGNERMANYAEWERRQRRRIARAIERAHGIGGNDE